MNSLFAAVRSALTPVFIGTFLIFLPAHPRTLEAARILTKHDRDAALFQMKEKPELVFSKGRKSSPGYI